MFEILSKFRVTENELEVSIRQDKPFTIITARISEKEDGTDDKVIVAILEAFYKTHYQDRARKEAIEEVKEAAEQAKQMAEELKPVLINGNTLSEFDATIPISNDYHLWPGQYKGLVMYLPEIKIGSRYANGQFVRIKDETIQEDAPTGQYVCVCLNKGDDWTYNGEDILGMPKPFQSGFDIRRYESYPRVKLGTVTDTKK